MTQKLTLAEMRARLKEQEDKKGGQGGYQTDHASYPFWNIPMNSTATIRFLPDGDDNNSYFWVERQIIKMPFPGVKGGDTNKPITVSVPCLDMYGKKCPIQAETKDWWNDPAMVDQARTYYKKRTYLYQALVVSSPFKEEKPPENPVRRLVINKSIHDKIKASLMDPDIEDMPTDFDNGLDFRLIKTQQGKYANYDTSSFARKTRSLNEEEREAIEKHGLFDLKSFLPKEPDEKTVKLIMEMFEDSVNGELFDAEKYKAFRASGGYTGGSAAASDSDAEVEVEEAVVVRPAIKVTPKPAAVEEVEEPTVTKIPARSEEAVTDAPKKSPQDVLAMLKARKQAKAE